MTPALFRCEYDGKLLRRSDIVKGKCLGHTVKLARQGSIIEWLIALYWKLTKQI